MNRIFLLFISIFLNLSIVLAQTEFQEFIRHVYQLPTVSEKKAAIDSFITYAYNKGVPFVEGTEANFIYKGVANSVAIAGDFNGWDYSNDKMTNIDGTGFFFMTKNFELDARLDYKFVVNESYWRLDPLNKNSVSGGFGPNSELSMPEYIQPWEIEYKPQIKHGERIDFVINSTVVGRSYDVTVYLPPSYKTSPQQNYPAAYFQDGSEYISLGSAINIIDNLIDSNKITEIIAVFVTPNNRNEEYAFNLRNKYADFFANELVPKIDSEYRTSLSAKDRLVIGDSYGGNISALISFKYPNVFGNCGLHSPAFQPNNYEVYNLIVDGEKENINFACYWGTYESLDNKIINFKDKLLGKGYSFAWSRFHEGHSWGLWRATTDLILKSVFPIGFTEVNNVKAGEYNFRLFPNYPNPFNPTTRISYSLKKRGNVVIEITDTLGEIIKQIVNETKVPGSYFVNFDGSNLSSGVYIYTIYFNGKRVSRKMQLIK